MSDFRGVVRNLADMTENQFEASLEALVGDGGGFSVASGGSNNSFQQQHNHHATLLSNFRQSSSVAPPTQTFNGALPHNTPLSSGIMAALPSQLTMNLAGMNAQLASAGINTQQLLDFIMQTAPQQQAQQQHDAASTAMPPPAASVSSRQSSLNKRPSNTVSSSISAVSEDEGDHKRRESRNVREQRRSQQISDQIGDLRQLLAASNVQTKPDKYSTLVTVGTFIRQLQERSSVLEKEHKKLLSTMQQTSELVSNQCIPVPTCGDIPKKTSSSSDSNCFEDNTSDMTSDNEEEKVYDSGLDYRSLFKSCPIPVAIASIDGRFLDCNQDFEIISGYAKAELFQKQTLAPPKPGDMPTNGHMSLFNVLCHQDMERLFAVMSQMLQNPFTVCTGPTGESEQSQEDRWNDVVVLNRRPDKQVKLNIHLVRHASGLPRFFNCTLLETDSE
jgi:PAS domain-containing protein